jgi:hypothetical protein
MLFNVENGCNISSIKGAVIKKRSFRPLFLFKNHFYILDTDIFCGCNFLFFKLKVFVKDEDWHLPFRFSF